MLKSHQGGDLTPAETKVGYLPLPRFIAKKENGFKRFSAATGSTERKCARFISVEKNHETILARLQNTRPTKCLT